MGECNTLHTLRLFGCGTGPVILTTVQPADRQSPKLKCMTNTTIALSSSPGYGHSRQHEVAGLAICCRLGRALRRQVALQVPDYCCEHGHSSTQCCGKAATRHELALVTGCMFLTAADAQSRSRLLPSEGVGEQVWGKLCFHWGQRGDVRPV